MLSFLRPPLVLLLILTLLTGVAYPVIVTGIARVVFPYQAAGSLVVAGSKPIGSALIGQNFSAPGHFWGRPSATAPQPYNAAASGGSNLGPLNPALTDAVQMRMDALRGADPGNRAPIPVDLVTASASGLDPDISVGAANYQVARVARARNVSEDVVRALIRKQARGRLLGWLGEPRVNVLGLNLALDAAVERRSGAVPARQRSRSP